MEGLMPQNALGPRGLPLIGSLLSVRKDPLHFFREAQKKYGDVVLIKLGRFKVYLVSHPDGIKYVLSDNHRNYHKSLLYDRMKPILGEGLLTSEGDFWQKERKLAQPAFHQQKIGKMTAVMVEETLAMLEKWKKPAITGLRINFEKEMMRLTSHIIVRTMFGNKLENTEAVEGAWNVVNEWIGSRHWALTEWSGRIPTRYNLRFRRQICFLEEFLQKMVASHRQSGEVTDDLLSMLLHVKDEETGEKMSDKQLRDEMMTIFIAGHETTSLALGWTCYLLAQNPPIFGKLREEIKAVLGERAPTFEDVPRLKYLKMVLEESMRLYPPAWGIGRLSLADDVINGYTIPKGALVFLLQYVTHRRSDLWNNPDKFNPENFNATNVSQRHRFAYFPFGGGPRVCIGNSFAMTEAIIILAMISQKFSFEPVENILPEMEPLLTLRSKKGIWLKIRNISIEEDKPFTPD